jgi:hypothetical protein
MDHKASQAQLDLKVILELQVQLAQRVMQEYQTQSL